MSADGSELSVLELSEAVESFETVVEDDERRLVVEGRISAIPEFDLSIEE